MSVRTAVSTFQINIYLDISIDYSIKLHFEKFLGSSILYLKKPSFSQRVTKAILYWSGSMGGFITGVIVVEGKVGKVSFTLQQATKSQRGE